MKIPGLILLIVFLLPVSETLGQSVVWAKQEGGQKDESAMQITTDADGNSYILGAFFQSTTTVGSQTLTIVNGDKYLAKYDTDGNFEWVQQVKNIYVSKIKAVGQYLYLCGSMNFLGTIGNSQLNTGSKDAILLRIDGTGNISLLIKSTGPGYEYFRSVDADNYGNIYATGVYDTVSVFGNDTLKGTVGGNYFLIKYNSQGNIVWKSTGTQKSQGINGEFISVSSDGTSCYTMAFVAGAEGVTDVDSVTFSNSSIHFQCYGNYNIILIKYNFNGTLMGIKSYYPGNHGNMVDIDQDTLGNVYVAEWGHYTHFGITKYDHSFNQAWYKMILSGTQSTLADIAVNNQGDIYLTGSFDKQLSFPGDTLKVKTPYTSFIAKYDQAGNYNWSTKFDKDSSNVGNSIAGISADRKGHLYVAGYFTDSVYIGSNAFASSGWSDIFIAKINDDEQFVGIKTSFLNETSSFDIFPNPTNGKFISTEKISAVYDMYGQKFNYNFRLNEIDLSEKPKGIYFVELKEGDTKTVKKIVLE